MKFIASKVLWFIANPGNLLLMALCLGTILLWTRWHRGGRRILLITAVIALLVAIVPFGNWMIVPLENRFPTVQELPKKVDGIIALGGVVNQFITAARGQPSLGGGIERITEMMVLSKLYPDAKLIFTGGSGQMGRQEHKEAEVVKLLFVQMGFNPNNLIFENQSRNTYENAIYSKELAQPKDGETWLLITSAFHMPRSAGVFRSVGWDVMAYPVDYSTEGQLHTGLSFEFAGGLGKLGQGLHEWLGLIAYRIMGRTSSLFPAP